MLQRYFSAGSMCNTFEKSWIPFSKTDFVFKQLKQDQGTVFNGNRSRHMMKPLDLKNLKKYYFKARNKTSINA